MAISATILKAQSSKSSALHIFSPTDMDSHANAHQHQPDKLLQNFHPSDFLPPCFMLLNASPSALLSPFSQPSPSTFVPVW
eukprot:8075806-Heterocapsa_arctica.AAC.1